MAEKVLSRARTILLATKFASVADIPALQTLISLYVKVLNRELLLRILLSYLPESLESVSYSYLLKDLQSTQVLPIPKSYIDISSVEKFCENEVNRLVRKLHLIHLAPPAPCDIATDSFSAFLIHRSLRIDESTGLINEIPLLLDPFIPYYPCLRRWMVSTVLPLLRLTYEYYPDDAKYMTIRKFAELGDKAAISYLLSKTGKDKSAASDSHVGRDIRGLIGPWLHKGTRSKQLTQNLHQTLHVETHFQFPLIEQKYTAWEEIFLWIIDQAEVSWETTVNAIEGWDGPGDYDIGDYEDDDSLKEDEKMHLKRRYIRMAISAAYTITEESKHVLKGIYRILVRIIKLMNMDQISSLEYSYTNLSPIGYLDSDVLSQFSVRHLKTLMNEKNPVTEPTEPSIKFLHASIISATVCYHLGCSISVKYMAMLALQKDEHLQSLLFNNLMLLFKNKSKEGDEFFTRLRNELHWLRSWGVEEFSNDQSVMTGRGIFGQLSKELIEIEFLKVLLSNARYDLARSIYETPRYQFIPHDTLRRVVLDTALVHYDSATNTNISRGGLKRCSDILKTFSKSLSSSPSYQNMNNLLQLTSKIEPYRLVLKRGEPFRPVNLRMHEDPIMILGKILEQNSKTYKKITEFIDIAKLMLQAGLIKDKGKSLFEVSPDNDKKLKVIESRIVSMCIDAALVEGDFETAYSYVITQSKNTHISEHKVNVNEQTDISQNNEVNDWLWRAALQAGKYRWNFRTSNKTSIPGVDFRGQQINHLEKRMECISQALTLAPRDTLLEILYEYRRCEEELNTLLQQETEQETHSFLTDDQNMPGSFMPTPTRQDGFNLKKVKDEEPISLFDLSRAGMMRAQSGLSAFSILKGKSKDSGRNDHSEQHEILDVVNERETDHSKIQKTVRKRDHFKNVAVGGLATGVGWLIGAPFPKDDLNVD